MKRKTKDTTPDEFWKKYYNSDVLGRDKILEKISKSLIRQVDELRDTVKPKIRERAVTVTLLGYFDDLIEYMINITKK
jgi:hypothetical protein